MAFTVEGTSLPCTITDDTGPTLSSASGTSTLFDSGYSAIGVYSDDAQTVEVYLSDYNTDGDTVQKLCLFSIDADNQAGRWPRRCEELMALTEALRGTDYAELNQRRKTPQGWPWL